MRERRTNPNKRGRICQIWELLDLAVPLHLSRGQLSECINDCHKSFRKWKGKRANFKSLVAGRIAREVVLHALESDDCTQVWCVDGTNIIRAYGVNVRVQAVCGAGRAVLVDPKNEVPIDLIVAIRVRFRHNSLKDVKLEYLGTMEWEKVATNVRYVPAGSRVKLLPTDDHPSETIIKPSKACYVVMTKDLTF